MIDVKFIIAEFGKGVVYVHELVNKFECVDFTDDVYLDKKRLDKRSIYFLNVGGSIIIDRRREWEKANGFIEHYLDKYL